MIVASLLLILVAVTLLVLGLAGGSSGLLIGSIVASLLAAVALVIGARQATAARRAVPVDGGLDEAEGFGRPVPARHPDIGADPPPPARPDLRAYPDADLRADPGADLHADLDADLRADPGVDLFADSGAGLADDSRADLPGDLRADSSAGPDPDPSDDLHAGSAGSADGGGGAFAEGDRDAAYAAGRRDAAEHVEGPESTQRVQPDADLYDGGAAGRPSSGQAAGPASSDGDDDRASSSPLGGSRAEGSPWAYSGEGSAGRSDDGSGSRSGDGPWSRGPGRGLLPEDDPAAAGEPGTARRGDRAGAAGLVDEFDEPDPDDPDDEPLPQAVRPADAVRVARLDAEVLVVDGRPRYHLADCPHLVGRLTEGLPVAEAVELGFSPCGLCRPVDRLVAAAAPR